MGRPIPSRLHGITIAGWRSLLVAALCGIFALWENNPWNPGTRYLMSRTPLDARAVPLAPPESRRMLAGQGFEVLQTDFLFIFPRVLAFLRRLEPPLCRLPLGGQYQVLALRP